MKRNLPKFWLLALFQALLVLAIVAVAFYFRTSALLAGPGDGDLYAHNWGFQLVVFGLLWLPATFFAITALLVVEHQLLKPYYLAQQTGREA